MKVRVLGSKPSSPMHRYLKQIKFSLANSTVASGMCGFIRVCIPSMRAMMGVFEDPAKPVTGVRMVMPASRSQRRSLGAMRRCSMLLIAPILYS